MSTFPPTKKILKAAVPCFVGPKVMREVTKEQTKVTLSSNTDTEQCLSIAHLERKDFFLLAWPQNAFCFFIADALKQKNALQEKVLLCHTKKKSNKPQEFRVKPQFLLFQPNIFDITLNVITEHY